MRKLYLVTLLSLLSFISSELLKVIQITRHGGRTPLHIKPDNYMQVQLGQLTVLGFNQHLLLGKWNRARYINNNHPDYKDFLPKEFEEDLIKVTTSRFQRTQFSAIGNMSGMYPGVIFKIASGDGLVNTAEPPLTRSYLADIMDNEKQVNLNVMDIKSDILFSTRKCISNRISSTQSNGSDMQEAIKNGKEVSEMITRFFDNDASKTGLTFLKNEEKQQLKEILNDKFQTIFAEKKIEEMTLSDFVKINDYLNFYHFSFSKVRHFDVSSIDMILRKISLRYIKNTMNKDQLLRIINTPFFKNILSEFEGIISIRKKGFLKTNGGKAKFLLYSGHDRNIQNFILSLFKTEYISYLYEKSMKDRAAYNFLTVPFASSFIFELHKYDQDLFVKIIYNGIEITDNLKQVSGADIEHVENYGFYYEDIKALLQSRIDRVMSRMLQ